jgi:hypothetical protein
MAFEMQIKVNGGWTSIAPTGGDPYRYETRAAAENMLRICYPDLCREDRLGSYDGQGNPIPLRDEDRQTRVIEV